MDRYEVPIDDHLAPLVEAAERGDEVVITDAGRVVARLAAAPFESPKPITPTLFRESLDEFREATKDLVFPRMSAGEAAQLVRDMRDEGY